MGSVVKISTLETVLQLIKYGHPTGAHFNFPIFSHHLLCKSSSFKKLCMVMASGAYSTWISSTNQKNIFDRFCSIKEQEMMQYVSNLVEKVFNVDDFRKYFPKFLFVKHCLAPAVLMHPRHNYLPLNSGLAVLISTLAARCMFSRDAGGVNNTSELPFDPDRALNIDFIEICTNIASIMEDTKQLLVQKIGKPL